jgi:NAD-dependent SIR2 family protein deacetylase
MTKVAVFTGAGASKALGYPLTAELLPRVRAELDNGKLFDDIEDEPHGRAIEAEDRDTLRRYLMALLPGFATVPAEQLPLITDVFSLLEYALASGEGLPVGGHADLRRFRDLLKQAICDVLLGDFFEEYDATRPEERRQKETLTRFVRWVEKQDDVGLVTTNYDIGLEFALYDRLERRSIAAELDLGFDWRDVETGTEKLRPPAPRLRVFKLHGSLDVLRCALCGYVYFNPWGAIAWRAFRRALDEFNTCHCNAGRCLELHIVSPSFVRDVREANLLNVWRSALEWLRTTDRWVIAGYSLPSEDLAIRSLLLRAIAGRKHPPEITVVQRGMADKPVYDLLFPGCRYEPDGLETFLAPAP